MLICDGCLTVCFTNAVTSTKRPGPCQICSTLILCNVIPVSELALRPSADVPPAMLAQAVSPVARAVLVEHTEELTALHERLAAIPKAPWAMKKAEEEERKAEEEKLPPPTHVLVGTSDGEKLTGERWMSLEDFAALFTYGETYRGDRNRGPERHVRLKRRS